LPPLHSDMQLSQQQCHENNLVTATLFMIYFVYKNLATSHSTLAAAPTAAVVCTSSCEERIEMARGLRPATSSSCTAPPQLHPGSQLQRCTGLHAGARCLRLLSC
jgi:hypothetical protein